MHQSKDGRRLKTTAGQKKRVLYRTVTAARIPLEEMKDDTEDAGSAFER